MNRNITLKKLSYDSTFGNTRLELNFKGKDVSYPLINGIRRISMTEIPIYYWDATISKNTSVFHNNYMKLRLKNLPIFGIENNNIFIKNEEKEETEKNDDTIDNFISMDNVDLESKVEKLDTSSLNSMIMYLDYVNKTFEIVTVTTDDCIFYYKGKKINSPYKVKIPIIKLQPNQEIKFNCVSKLGKELESSIFSPVSIFAYDMKSEDDFDVFIESRGQIDEKEILLRSITILSKQLNDFVETIPNDNDMMGKFKVGDMDHTIGNVLAFYALKHKNVDMFSYNLPHPLDRTININYKINKGEIKDVIKDTVKVINIDLDIIKKNIEKIKLD